MDAPLNFAVIGCGSLAQNQHIPNIAESDKAVLHTCCDVSDEALSQCRDTHGALHVTKDYMAAIRDPEIEVLCVATRQNLRRPIIEAAAEAGKPVYVEKPVANTLEEMYEIQRIVRETRIPFCVGHNRRNSPAMIDAHRTFRSHMENPLPCPWRFEREGPRPTMATDGVAAMSVRINDDWYSWKMWAFNRQEGGPGAMLFEMTHFTDLCNWFMAAEPEEVAALSRGELNHGVIIQYATGEMATIMMAGNGSFGYPKELYEMMGNGGVVVVDHMMEIRTAGIEGAEPRRIYPTRHDRHPHVGTEGGIPGWLAKKRAACEEAAAAGNSRLIFAAEPDKGHSHAIDRFVDEIRGQGPVVCGVDEAVLATRVAFAAIKAAEQRRVVWLEEV